MTILQGQLFAGGIPVTGTLYLRPSADAVLRGGACGTGLVLRTPPYIFNLVGGVIAGPVRVVPAPDAGAGSVIQLPYSVPGADCLTPSGITYHMTVTNQSGAIILTKDNIAIRGTYYDPFTDVEIIPVPPPPPSPPPAALRWVNGGLPGLSFDPPRDYTLAGPYATGLWSFEFDASHDGTKINNGVTTAAGGAGLTTPAPGGGATSATLDLGVGTVKAFGRFDFWTDTPIPADYTRFGIGGPVLAVDYSDDGAAWVNARTTSFGVILETMFWQDPAVGGVYPSHVEIPSGIGAHRYWRFLFLSADQVINVYEIQALTFLNAALGTSPDGSFANFATYEIVQWPGGGFTPTFLSYAPAATVAAAVFIPVLPTDAATFWDLPAPVDQALILPGTYPIVVRRDEGGGGFTEIRSGVVRTRTASGLSLTATPFYSIASVMP